MEIVLPEFERLHRPAGVYQISFDDKWLYIGSSIDLRSRIRSWVTKFNNEHLLNTINIKKVLPMVYRIEITVLLVVKDNAKLHAAETSFIRQYWDSDCLLNRCPEGGSNFGLRRPIGYVPKPKKVPIDNRKMVATYTKSGDLISVFNSKMAFCKEMNIKDDVLNRILAGKRSQPKQYTVKQIMSDGSVIDPPVFSKRISTTPRFQPNKMKPVNQVDVNGNVVAQFNHFKEAAKYAGVSWRYLHMVLNSKPDWKAHGYHFRYA